MKIVQSRVDLAIAALLWTCACVAVDLQLPFSSSDEGGSIFKLDDIDYYASPVPVLSFDSEIVPPKTLLATSVKTNNSQITLDFLLSRFTSYSDLDDVWNQHFLDAIVLQYDGPGSAYLAESAARWLESGQPSYLLLVGTNIQYGPLENVTVLHLDESLPPGPKLVSSRSIHDVYRLYKDDHEAFLFGTLPDTQNDGWIPTDLTSSDGPQYIPIPSRLSSLGSSLPLAGKRFALKDIYDARGLQTSAGSLAYAKTHPPSKTTAPSIQSLISLGAVLIGKTKTSQFAHGANPWEFVDFSYPWNPRGDGHLTAASSSSGSACVIAAYEWLDFAIGSDTRGSVRKPATLVAAYGIRPTWGSMDLDGVVPLSAEMDTAGFFARDPDMFYTISRLWYAESPIPVHNTFVHYPRKLLYPIDHFPLANPVAQTIYDQFVNTLTTHLGFTKVPINITSTIFPHLPNSNFTQFQLSSNILGEYYSWNHVGKPIVDKYSEEGWGYPQFDPNPTNAFVRAKHLTDADYQRAVDYKRQFGDFFVREVIKPHPDSCSDSIFIYDTGTGGVPSYRFEDLNAIAGATPLFLATAKPDNHVSDFFNYLASAVGLPDISVPLGHVSYFSHVSRKWEALPVGVQLVAHRGCDGMLLELIRELFDMGVIRETKVGSLSF